MKKNAFLTFSTVTTFCKIETKAKARKDLGIASAPGPKHFLPRGSGTIFLKATAAPTGHYFAAWLKTILGSRLCKVAGSTCTVL